MKTAEEYYGDDKIAIDVIKQKYLGPGEVGPEQMWRRIAKAIASVEKTDKFKEEWEGNFYDILEDFRFIPGGRINHAAGFETPDARLPSLSNCYYIPIEEDSTEAIMDWCKNAALVYRSGGGVGTDISVLRPKGAPVNASVGTAPGSVSFMNLMSETTETIAQNGRRGALMITLRVDHPDIEEFITIKSDTDTVKHANISVKLTNEFMKAVSGDKDFKLRWGGKTFKTVKAKALWDKIISQAHEHAEPGLMFWDHMTDDHNIEYCNPIMGTNPCGEIPLPSWDACNLAHLNLSKYVDPDGKFWFDTFKKDVKVGVRFLDNVITYNIDRHALPIISETVTNNRRTGLGITGLADALIKMGIAYDSLEAIEFADTLFSCMKESAYTASIGLAKERGSFEGFNATEFLKSGFAKKSLPKNIKDGIREIGMRNCTLLTIAPVGTGSIIGQCSSGMEPIYQLWYDRDVKRDTSRGEKDTYKVYHKLINDMFGDVSDRKELPAYVRTAYDVSADMRVNLQGVIQRHIDSSISSTINLPKNVKKEIVSDIYIKAWEAGLKGVTVYREGSREGVIRTVEEPKEAGPKKRPVKLDGSIYKIPIQQDAKLYVTICPFDDDASRPFEVFLNINNGDSTRQADLDAMSWMISALLRRTDNIDFILDKFRKTTDPSIRAWFSNPYTNRGTTIGSIPKAIAVAFDMFIYEHAKGRKKKDLAPNNNFKRCGGCGESAVIHENGCDHCIYCGFSEGCS